VFEQSTLSPLRPVSLHHMLYFLKLIEAL
jgi:hypothetical protein